MFKIKRLYTYLIQAYIPVFMMTFCICLFIFLMQFLWKYIEDLVGKGLDGLTLAELFFYSALGLIPMALPLAILLASLMTFGALGEKLELLSIKAAGVSLLKAMKPLIILIAFVAIGDFVFQNDALPYIKVKSASLLVSAKQKSPELDIPEGSFYSGIPRHNMYVKKKDKITGMLHEVMIYDTSEGFDNMSVFVCDSAKMQVSASKDFLLLTLYTGQRFANFRHATSMTSSSTNSQFVPYGKESFKEKRIIIPFNSDFNRIDEAAFGSSQISKNVSQLQHSMDSMSILLDSLNVRDKAFLKSQILFNKSSSNSHTVGLSVHSVDSISGFHERNNDNEGTHISAINLDSLFTSQSHSDMLRILSSALNESESYRNSYNYQPYEKMELQKSIRMHNIEWHRKFSYSFACLIFFFIGAPLGAIIRKGGLGMPVVVSVLLFIVYYIIDNIGYKMARDGVWDEWQGIWLSAFCLFPLGVFLTYKAMNDSTLFNPEVYNRYVRKLLKLRKAPAEESKYRAVIESQIPALSTLSIDEKSMHDLNEMDNMKLSDIAANYQAYQYDENTLMVVLSILKERGASLFNLNIKNLDRRETENNLTDFSKNSIWAMLLYFVSIFFTAAYFKFDTEFLGWGTFIATIVYFAFYVKTIFNYLDFYSCIDKKEKKSFYTFIKFLLAFVAFFILMPLMKRRMNKDMTNTKW